jgi:hypothetical protein
MAKGKREKKRELVERIVYNAIAVILTCAACAWLIRYSSKPISAKPKRNSGFENIGQIDSILGDINGRTNKSSRH